jgi:2-polyprenyl-3-methyl-5-hydroxy-6-metoxy-1,4-benzoquinol methylase
MSTYADRLLAFQARPDWLAETTELLDRLPFSLTGRRVLDFGCGPGALSLLLAERGASVVALDTDLELLCCAKMAARDRRLRIEHQHYQGTVLPFFDRRFDVVIASHVLGHVVDPERTLRDLYRITAPGGVLGVSNPNWWNWVLRLPANLARGYRSDPTAKWSFTAGSLRRQAERRGWSCLKSWHTGERLGGVFPAEAFRSRFCLLMQRGF